MRIYAITYRVGLFAHEKAKIIATSMDAAVKQAKRILKSNGGDLITSITYEGDITR